MDEFVVPTVGETLAETVAAFHKMAEMQGQPVHPSLYGWVLDNGEEFTPANLDIEMGEPKNCFENAGQIALYSDEWDYAEGYAFSNRLLEHHIPIPIHHGWLVNADGETADPTWPDGGHSYYGIALSTERQRLAVVGCGTWDVLEWVANRQPEWFGRESISG